MSNTSIEKRENTAGTVNVPAERTEQGTWYTPLVDIIEDNDAFLFQADLPGVSPGDIDVSYENGVLTIAAKAHPRQPQGHRYVWREYGVGHFYRQFTLNTPVDADAIRAEYRNGVLDLTVPKAASAKPRRIEIKST